MRFPHDEGSHPEFRLEWWYVTGWLDQVPEPLGFQITFFRARPDLKHDNPSAFTPRQIVIAHAALSDPAQGRLLHVQKAARAGFGLAGADEGRMRVWIDDWSLEKRDGTYHARIASDELQFQFMFDAKQPLLLQGEDGFSRKGPAPASASYYYSMPHLTVRGTLTLKEGVKKLNGMAWLDHEWSSEYMAQEAVGWDWIGINLDDGGALMLFRMRDRTGGQFWAGGTLRRADGKTRAFSPVEVRFTPQREWRSPRTGVRYPVSWQVEAAGEKLTIEPLMDDQEHDARASSGGIYWEGAVRALRAEKPVGRGYLELTGYWRPLKFRTGATEPFRG
jgi:predicted secreted hydrolase